MICRCTHTKAVCENDSRKRKKEKSTKVCAVTKQKLTDSHTGCSTHSCPTYMNVQFASLAY